MVRATRLLAIRKAGTRRKTFFATLPCQLLMGMFKDLSLNMHNLWAFFVEHYAWNCPLFFLFVLLNRTWKKFNRDVSLIFPIPNSCYNPFSALAVFALSASSYGKALHVIKYADPNGFPIITFVNTPGAFADLKSEELGQVPSCLHALHVVSSVMHIIHAIYISCMIWPFLICLCRMKQ